MVAGRPVRPGHSPRVVGINRLPTIESPCPVCKGPMPCPFDNCRSPARTCLGALAARGHLDHLALATYCQGDMTAMADLIPNVFDRNKTTGCVYHAIRILFEVYSHGVVNFNADTLDRCLFNSFGNYQEFLRKKFGGNQKPANTSNFALWEEVIDGIYVADQVRYKVALAYPTVMPGPEENTVAKRVSFYLRQGVNKIAVTFQQKCSSIYSAEDNQGNKFYGFYDSHGPTNACAATFKSKDDLIKFLAHYYQHGVFMDSYNVKAGPGNAVDLAGFNFEPVFLSV